MGNEQTKWRASGNEVFGGKNGTDLIASTFICASITTWGASLQDSRANAKLIAKHYNNHDRLKEALETMLAIVESYRNDVWDHHVQKAREALALSEEKE